MTTDWGHVAEITAAVVSAATGGSVPVMLYIMATKKKEKKEADQRRAEEQERLTRLITENKYYPAHKHGERAGVLQAENIDYPPER